jgi:hypothetical protein
MNDNKFYLLVDIPDNTTTIFNDTINDNNLGIDYNINNTIKYITLPENNIKVFKLPIKIIINNDKYQATNMNNELFIFPLNFDDIYEIYIETFNTDSTTSRTAGTLNTDGVYKHDNEYFEINPEYKTLNYLTSSINLMDNHKIIYSKNNLSNDLKILNKKLYHFKP